jgi:hypothetical protein
MRTMLAAKGFSMEKWLCLGAMGVAGLLLLVFVLDLAIKVPFDRLSSTVDVCTIIASAFVFYMAWDAYKDLK